MDKKLRAYYVRQLQNSGWQGNAGGWVFGPNGNRVQGWDSLIRHLARRLDAYATNYGRVLGWRPR